ncbi:MAG: UDP-N-acetylmuramate dehydrogenase, partial [Polyangiales bacterium]
MEQGRRLAELTTLKLGGPARYFESARDRTQLVEALAWARAQGEAVHVLGGGSNLLVGDEGVSGLVLQVATRGIALAVEGAHGVLTVQAGEVWDDVVSLAIDEGLAGIECLTGIPGSTGATPIQNVGAYGQEVAEVIDEVEVLERATGAVRWMRADECGFAYRDSRFKRSRDFVVLAVRLRLRRDGVPTLRYPELVRAVGDQASLHEVRSAVRALRASKGMLLEEGFVPSAGSFFTNPVLPRDQAERLPEMPRFDAGDAVKLSAAWLIEHAGFAKGTRRGDVGISDKHSLALVNHGGTSAQLLAFAQEIQAAVSATFGVRLEREPGGWAQNAESRHAPPRT